MTIDIDQLREAELIDLNHRIVARLRLLRQPDAHASMLEFRIDERVRFHPDGRSAATGTITRYNKKTVSIVTEDGHLWNVAPQLLERVTPKDAGTTDAKNVIALHPDKHSR